MGVLAAPDKSTTEALKAQTSTAAQATAAASAGVVPPASGTRTQLAQSVPTREPLAPPPAEAEHSLETVAAETAAEDEAGVVGTVEHPAPPAPSSPAPPRVAYHPKVCRRGAGCTCGVENGDTFLAVLLPVCAVALLLLLLLCCCTCYHHRWLKQVCAPRLPGKCCQKKVAVSTA